MLHSRGLRRQMAVLAVISLLLAGCAGIGIKKEGWTFKSATLYVSGNCAWLDQVGDGDPANGVPLKLVAPMRIQGAGIVKDGEARSLATDGDAVNATGEGPYYSKDNEPGCLNNGRAHEITLQTIERVAPQTATDA